MKSRVIALLIGLLTFGGFAGIRYPNYYTLNIPNPVSASSGAASAMSCELGEAADELVASFRNELSRGTLSSR